MKNKLFFVMLSVAFLVPQVIYAAWWNPLSWFNRWTFQPEKQESVNLNTEITHSEIQNQQTERKEDTTNTVESDSVKKNLNNTSKINGAPVQVVSQNNIPKDQVQIDFRAECNLNKKEVELGDSVKADLKLYFQQSKDFQVKWPEKNLIKLIDWNEALFAVDDYGDFDFSPTVTRISDGYSKKIPCSVYIECDQYECLSLAGKRLYKVRQILEEVSSWNNGEYSNLTSSDKCNIAESIIRAYEYEYGLIGGTQLPVFSKGLDCASNVSIAAYEYKLKVLEQTLPVE